MSTIKHYYGQNHLHFVTTSTYRRARLFDSERFKNQWVATLAAGLGQIALIASSRSVSMHHKQLDVCAARP